MRTPIIFLCLALCTQTAHAQLLNADFENWYTDTTGHKKLTGWEHLSKTDAIISSGTLYGTWQDNNSEHGNYALMLSRWYSYAWDKVRMRTVISIRPTILSGYYKYIKTNLVGAKTDDTAGVDVYMTVWNTTLNKSDTIGIGRQKLSAVSAYTPFNCHINYSVPSLPDSIQIQITPSIFRGIGADCADSNYCSFLTIDDLIVADNDAVNAVEPLNNGIIIYPTPAKDIIHILSNQKIKKVAILNMMGRVAYAKTVLPVDNVIFNIEGLLPGIYILRVDDQYVQRIIKQ